VAASDEFPRGMWLMGQVVEGVQCVVTFPSLPGIAWVLTDIMADAVAYPTVSTHQHIVAANGSVPIVGVITFNAQADAGVSKDSWSWTGQVFYTVNQPVQVSFDAVCPPGCEQHLNCHAYPI